MRAILTFTLIMALAVLIPFGTVMAISVAPVSYEQTLANAEMIVVGTVTDIHTRWSGVNESMIATDYTIRLDHIAHDPQALFGSKSRGETIVLSFAGGTIGKKWVVVPGVPTYELGEQAVFFIDGDGITDISPLVGAIAGDYRVSDAGFVSDAAGRLVDRTFFSGGIDKSNGFSVEEFVTEIKRALPYAEADKSLIISHEVEIPEEIAHLVFTGDQIPQSDPILSDDFSYAHEVSKPQAVAALPVTAPKPEEDIFNEPGEFDYVEEGYVGADKYAFLWVPPDRTSNFNVPPILVSGGWGPNFEQSLVDWNMYADLFRIYTTPDNNFGHQGRNDFAFTTPATFLSVYGFSLGSTTLGIAVMYNAAGTYIGNQPGQKIDESDVILNVDFSWTVDWQTGYDNCNVWFLRPTTIHELGHCFGREHQMTADPSADYNSVMNYPPCGALDTEFWLPFVDDPQSIRAAYPANAASISDIGVHLFHTSNLDVLWSTFSSSVVAGNSFSMNNYVIENMGTTAMTPTVAWYLTPTQQSYTGAIYMSTSSFGSLGTFAYWKTNSTISVPSSVPPGQYYIAAYLQPDDGQNWNRSAWSNTKITITCPQVATVTGLGVTAGCGYNNLTWSSANNATSYRIYRDGAYLTAVSGTTYRDNSPGTSQRCYRIAGQNNCDLGNQSAQVCRTALFAPAIPAGFSCTAGCGYIDLNWSNTSGATSYRVYRGGTWIASPTSSSYRDNSPGSSTQCYTVRASNSCGLSAATSQRCCKALAVPASITGMSCTPGCGYIDASWNAASGATSYRLYRDGTLLTTVTGTSFRDNSPGSSQRCYTVRAQNSCGMAGAPTASCCTALAAPPPPSSVSCTPRCGSNIISWSAVSGVNVYCIYRDGALLACMNTDTAGTIFGDHNPGSSQRCYRVTARNNCGESAMSQQTCCTMLMAPAPPASLTCAPGCGYISLDWSPSAGATQYRVYRDGSFLIAVSGSGYQDNSPGTSQRCYEITAVNACGESGNSPRSCCTALSAPAPPSSLTCAPGCGFIQLGWPASAGATQYRVYRDGVGLTTVSGTSYQDNSPGTSQRCYEITAINACGESGNSPRSCCTASAGPSKVFGLQATNNLCDTIRINWNAVAGASGYRIYRNGTGVTTVGGTTFWDYTGNDTCHVYTVSAIDTCGEGPRSDPVNGCSVCDDQLSISGYMVYYDMVKHIPGVRVDLTGGAVMTTMSDATGWYGFAPLASANYLVTPSRSNDDAGVSIGDVIKIRRHLAFIELLDSPYKLLAADVNCGGTVSVSDIIKIRRYLAHLEGLPCGNWVFVDSSFAINNANWFTAPNSLSGFLNVDWTDSSFVGIRYGDVNNTWAPPGPAIADGRRNPAQSAGNATVRVTSERDVMVGDLINVQVEANGAGNLSGFELHLNYSIDELAYENVTSAIVSNFTYNVSDGQIHLVWDDINSPVDATETAQLFTVSFRVRSGMTDSGEIGIDGEIVDLMGDPYGVAWQSGYVVMASPAAVDADDGLMPGSFYLSTNYPNPFNPETHIEFGLPQAEHVSLVVYNVMGQRVAGLVDQAYSAGDHVVTWNGRDDAGHLVGSGVYFYRLEAGTYMQTRKMTLMK